LPYKKDIPIQSVLSVINEQTGFLEQFTHDILSQQHNRPENEALLATLIESTAGLYGDLQGIAGKNLQEIDGLELPLIAEDNEAA